MPLTPAGAFQFRPHRPQACSLAGVPVGFYFGGRMARKRPAEERFWEKVNKNGPVPRYNPSLGKCWEWTASCGGGGKPPRYGQFKVRAGLNVKAHRYSYGAGPEDLSLDHLCRNTICVRPSHLEAVTIKVNILRGTSPCALNHRKTSCPKGHLYYLGLDGRRRCRKCKNASFRKWRIRNLHKARQSDKIRARRYRADKLKKEV